MPYKAIWKYINIIILWEIGNYKKGNKNEKNDKIGWILEFSDEKVKNWWFFAIYRYLAIFSQKLFKKGFAPLCYVVIVNSIILINN